VSEVAFGVQAVGRTQVFEWFFKLKIGVTSVKDTEHSEQPSMCETKMRIECKKLSSKTSESLPMK
jgi:hypothetical protein